MPVDFRRIVANDSAIGAGNFFLRYSASCQNPDAVLLESDEHLAIGAEELGTSLTVAELRNIVERLAAWFAQREVQPGVMIAVFIPDSAVYYLYYLALTSLGAVPVLLNSNMPAGTAADYLRKVGCSAVVVDRQRAGCLLRQASFPLDGMKVFTIEDIALGRAARSSLLFGHSASDNVLIAHTSGTTGAPKPVQFNHGGYFYGVHRQMFHPLGRRVLSALPHSHGAAITLFMSTVIRGVPLFAQTRKDASHILDSIEGWKPNLVMAFPKPLVGLCRTKLAERSLDSVACWMSTGDASHESHIKTLMSVGTRMEGGRLRKGSFYIDNLGSSEVAFGVLRNVHSPETNHYDRCIGRPFEWMDVRIFGEEGRAIAGNEVGRLGVRSRSVTSGYLNDDAATRANRIDGYWLTGDLVYRGENGLYFHVDRTADRELVADRWIYSCQLEERLMKGVAGIFDCTVVAVSAGAERNVAVAVEPVDEEGDPRLLEAQIRDALTAHGVTVPVTVKLIQPDWNDGLTGKKLKRIVRAEFNTEARAAAGGAALVV